MKKLVLLLLVALGSTLTASATVKIYLNPNVWSNDGAWFALCMIDGLEQTTWTRFTAVAEHAGIYEATLTDGTEKYILVRMWPSTADGYSSDNNGLNWPNKWNQTIDITLFPSKDYYFQIDNNKEGDNYKVDNNSLLPWAYYLVSNKNGEWQADEIMTGTDSYTCTFGASDYQGKNFSIAQGSALWAGGTIKAWSSVLRPTTTENADVEITFSSSSFADYNVTPVTGSQGSVWKIPSSVDSRENVTISFDNSANKVSISPTIDVTIGSAGYSTFSSAYDVDIPENVEAYYAKDASSSSVTLKKLNSAIADNYGVLLKGSAGDRVKFTPATTTPDEPANLLHASVTETPVAASKNGVNHYFLAGTDAATIGFYNIATATNSAAGKAFLETENELMPAGARVAWVFDEVSGIKPVVEQTVNGLIYDLQGRKVSSPKAGLYIQNGKKVIIK